MKFTIGTASSNREFKETMSLIKSSLLYADEIELIGMVEYMLFSYIPGHLNDVKDMDQLLMGIKLLLKSLDAPGTSELLSQIEDLNEQLNGIAPLLKKKRHRNKQELIAQMKIQQVFRQSKGVILEGVKELIDTPGANAIQELIEREIITVHNYGYDQFQFEELMGGYFGNLINAMKNHGAYPLFDEVSVGVIRSVANTHILDISRTNAETLRHAGVASNILMTLPTLEGATVDEILDFKKENEEALIRFRKAIYEFSEKIETLPWDNDFHYDCMKLYSVEVAPKVAELNEISSDTNVLLNLGKKAVADAEVRRAAGFAIGGIAATILSQNGFMEAMAVLRDMLIGTALLSVSPQIASGFLKSIDLVNKSRDEVKDTSRNMKGNTMYYYYKASKKI